MAFRGWPTEAITFDADLEADNTKAFWEAHRATYAPAVKQPFAELSAAVADEFGPLHLFRPHRDVRFSKDKSPYKIAAGAVAEGEGGTRFYVEISSTGLRVASGYYHLLPDQLERWRAAVADDASGPVIEAAVAEVRRRGLDADSREKLVRAPRGYPKDHPRIDTWRQAEPLTRLLDRHIGPSHLPPEEVR